MEKILRIEETTFKRNNDDYGNFEGYQVVTDKQTIKMGIENGQSCCENWGYLMSEDDLSDFIGADLIDVKVTDTQLKNKEEFDTSEMYEGSAMFIDFYTSNGVLQFVAYNEHNGYYGHDAVLISNQLELEECL